MLLLHAHIRCLHFILSRNSFSFRLKKLMFFSYFFFLFVLRFISADCKNCSFVSVHTVYVSVHHSHLFFLLIPSSFSIRSTNKSNKMKFKNEFKRRNIYKLFRIRFNVIFHKEWKQSKKRRRRRRKKAPIPFHLKNIFDLFSVFFCSHVCLIGIGNVFFLFCFFLFF